MTPLPALGRPRRRLSALARRAGPAPRRSRLAGPVPPPPSLAGLVPLQLGQAGAAPLPAGVAGLRRITVRHPRAWAAALVGLAAAVAGFGAGPVAGALAGAYSAGVLVLVGRHRATGRAVTATAATTDAVADMAAELRAGAPPAAVVATAAWVLRATPSEWAAVGAAWRVSERTGAPLAEVLDKVEAQLRQTLRLEQTVAAHRAGVRATALLLAVLPAGGIGLGYGIGADPAHLLLHTPLGAACAGLAGLLQIAGCWWAEVLSRVDAS